MQPDLIPFRSWCAGNGIGVTNGYALANSGKLHIVKLGRKSYVTKEESERFVKSLPAYKAENAGG